MNYSAACECNLQMAFAKLGRRPTPKTSATRDRHETELSHVSIVIAMAEREVSEPAPPEGLLELLLDEDVGHKHLR